MENQNSPQQQAADLRMMLDNEPPKQRSSRRNSRGTTLSDIDTMSYDELVAYISDSNSDFADGNTEFDDQGSLYAHGKDNSSVSPPPNALPAFGEVSTSNSLADEIREEEERAKRAVPYSFASLGKKQPANDLKIDTTAPFSESTPNRSALADSVAADSHRAADSAMRTTTPDPDEYINYPQQEAFQDGELSSNQFSKEKLTDEEHFSASFDQTEFDAEGYDAEGYDAEGFDRDGFDREGFDRNNYDREGYDWEGYNWEGFDRDGFDRDGFDRDNYDREGYDWEGYNQYGLDRQGFDRNGFDSEGYDREGFNNDGFDREGFDRDGFDQYNYDRNGYDWEGYDYEGYDYGGFDRDGYDKEGYTRQDWEAAGYKFGPRGEFILQETEQQNTEAENSDQQNFTSEERAQTEEQSEPIESKVKDNLNGTDQNEGDKVNATETELPEYNFAATPPLAANTSKPELIQEYTAEEVSETDTEAKQAPSCCSNSADITTEQPDNTAIHQSNDVEYTQPEDDQPENLSTSHSEDEPQSYVEEYSHQDLTQQSEAQPYVEGYSHRDLPQQSEAQPYVEEYSHQDLTQQSEAQPSATAATPIPQDAPKSDVPLYDPQDKFGHMTSPWSYECDYAIDYESGNRRGQRVALLASELDSERTFTIGSPGERVNDIEVDESTVANDQALLRYNNGRFTLINFQEDIKINKRIVTCGEQVNLMTGDEITLGSTTLVFRERCVSEALAEYSINVIEGAKTDLGKSFPLTKQRSSIGRDRYSDIPLTDQEISRHHCTLTFRAGKFFLQHRSDTNPTFINGVSVPVGGERQITTDDKIQISSRTILQLIKY